MRLAEFILADMEAILTEWEAFAATLLPAAEGMNSLELRDHAKAILEAIAKDIETPQTRLEQSEKSKGRAPVVIGAPETAAQTHAVLRARGGFNIIQLVAEYRALRASVLRLWLDAHPTERRIADEVIRFNEAIDQAIAESVGHFHAQVERARNLLLGMLGHDMQSPLSSIFLTAKHLSALNAGEQVSLAADRLIRSGGAMQALLDDLVEFNRTRLGLGVKVVRRDIDLSAVTADEVEQLRGAYPKRRIELAAIGDTRGRWDGQRLQQVVRNLVSNAVRYGTRDAPISVRVKGDGDSVCIDVVNAGEPIDEETRRRMFEPLMRGTGPVAGDDTHSGLGLGLFVVHEITRAHGGDVDVRCEGGKTTFSVRLPRERQAVHRAAPARAGKERA